MKKMLFSAALAMLITGCAQQTFTVGNKPTAVTPKETITHHFFVSGIGQEKTVDAAKICGGAENVVKTETQQTFVNGLLGFITFGIYTPLEAGYIAHNSCPSIWGAHLHCSLIYFWAPYSCFCIVISLSLREEIILFSDVCQSGLHYPRPRRWWLHAGMGRLI